MNSRAISLDLARLLRKLTAPAAMVALAAVVSCRQNVAYHGNVVDPPKDVASFTFTRSDGSPFSTAVPRGQVQLVFFGYTNCPDVCPTVLADWARVRKQLGADSARVRFLFVTVDPKRDTPSVAQQYVAQFSPAFVGLSGDENVTTLIQRAYGVTSEIGSGSTPDNYPVGHSVQSFVLNDKSQIVLIYGHGAEWQGIADDLHTLLH